MTAASSNDHEAVTKEKKVKKDKKDKKEKEQKPDTNMEETKDNKKPAKEDPKNGVKEAKDVPSVEAKVGEKSGQSKLGCMTPTSRQKA